MEISLSVETDKGVLNLKKILITVIKSNAENAIKRLHQSKGDIWGIKKYLWLLNLDKIILYKFN